MKNSLPEGFFKQYRIGKKNSTVYLSLSPGFLKLEYGLYNDPVALCLVSFVLENNDDAIAIGSRLEISGQYGTEVTYISENGVSGFQWTNGEVIWGHTYDDSPPSSGEKIELGTWFDKMLDTMINPTKEEIDERRRLDKE